MVNEDDCYLLLLLISTRLLGVLECNESALSDVRWRMLVICKLAGF